MQIELKNNRARSSRCSKAATPASQSRGSTRSIAPRRSLKNEKTSPMISPSDYAAVRRLGKPGMSSVNELMDTLKEALAGMWS